MEIPEYLWASVEGDPHNDSPFFYGRRGSDGWTRRYEKLEPARWVKNGASLELVSPVKGGFTVSFKVIPKDRMLEVHSGIKNGSDKKITNVNHVLCAGTNTSPTLSDSSPELSRLYADGKVISWNGTGQSLSGSRFRAFVKGYEPAGFTSMPKLDGNVSYSNKLLDLASIAKGDREGKKFMVVYSAPGREAFTNRATPCYHTNTASHEAMNQNASIDVINPGEEKWVVHYYTFFEGDLAKYYSELAIIDQRLRNSQTLGPAEPSRP